MRRCRRRAGQKSTALIRGTLIDRFGGKPLRNSVILLRGGCIQQIDQAGALRVPEGADVISTEGMNVLPGLWDMHIHLMINGHVDYAHWDKPYPARIFERLAYFQITPYGRRTLEKKLRQLREPGVILLVGTDNGIPMTFHSRSTRNELG